MLKIWALLVGGFVLLCVPAYAGPAFLEEASAMFALVPVLSIHLFHALGVPGLLERRAIAAGACANRRHSVSRSWRCSGFRPSGLPPWGLAYLSGRRSNAVVVSNTEAAARGRSSRR
jgi:hypothetical protein